MNSFTTIVLFGNNFLKLLRYLFWVKFPFSNSSNRFNGIPNNRIYKNVECKTENKSLSFNNFFENNFRVRKLSIENILSQTVIKLSPPYLSISLSYKLKLTSLQKPLSSRKSIQCAIRNLKSSKLSSLFILNRNRSDPLSLSL